MLILTCKLSLKSKYPLELNYGVGFLGKPFDPRDVPLVLASEDERIQYLMDNFVNYNTYFNELIDEIRRFYYVEKKVNISRILNLFNYLAGVASVYLVIDEKLSGLRRLRDLAEPINNNSGEVFVLVSEKDQHPGFNSWLYSIVEGINLITFPKFKSVHDSPKLLLQVGINWASILKNRFTAAKLSNFKQIYYIIFRDQNLTIDNRQFFVVTLWIVIYIYHIDNFITSDINSIIHAIVSEPMIRHLDRRLKFYSVLYSYIIQLTNKQSLSKILDMIKLYVPPSTDENYDEDKFTADTFNSGFTRIYQCFTYHVSPAVAN